MVRTPSGRSLSFLTGGAGPSSAGWAATGLDRGRPTRLQIGVGPSSAGRAGSGSGCDEPRYHRPKPLACQSLPNERIIEHGVSSSASMTIVAGRGPWGSTGSIGSHPDARLGQARQCPGQVLASDRLTLEEQRPVPCDSQGEVLDRLPRLRLIGRSRTNVGPLAGDDQSRHRQTKPDPNPRPRRPAIGPRHTPPSQRPRPLPTSHPYILFPFRGPSHGTASTDGLSPPAQPGFRIPPSSWFRNADKNSISEHAFQQAKGIR